jgi:glycosyltransferase involved in cell wall biosynthesis
MLSQAEQLKESILVSVISPCRNEVRHIEGFVESLLAQDYPADLWDLIVADGMSDDGTREILRGLEKKHAPRLRVIENPGRIVSIGLNEAIRQARGRYIVRVDCHTEYAPDYIRRSIEVLEKTGADNAGGPARTKAKGFLAEAIAAAYHSGFSCGGARFHNPDYEGYVDTVVYGCWRTSIFEKIGLFDETLVRNQDDELNLRITRSGGKIWQSPAIASWYYPRGRLSALFCQYFQYGFWKVAVIRKHKLPASWRHLVPGAFVGGNLALLAAILCAGLAGQTGAFHLAIALLAVADGLYVVATTVAAAVTARRYGWRLLPILPAVFAVYHVSYGLGFLAGLSRLLIVPRSLSSEGAFTRLSR